jgi:hypothetical protein
MYAALAQGKENDRFRFTVPADFLDCMVIGIVRRPGLRWDFLLMEADIIDAHKIRKGGFFEIEAERSGQKYVSNGDTWPMINGFDQRI